MSKEVIGGEKVKTGTEDSLPKHFAEKTDVVVVRGRYTVRIFYFEMVKIVSIFLC